MDDRHQKLIEAIEACRPGRKDLEQADGQLPELADLAEAVRETPEWRARYDAAQQWDARVADAYRDVPCPDGLAERISARIAAESAESQSGIEAGIEVAEEVADVDAAAGEASTPSSRSRRANRRMWAALALLAAALMVAGFWLLPGRSLTPVQVVDRVPGWLGDVDPEGWQNKQLPPGRPPSALLGYRPEFANSLQAREDRSAAVYRYDAPLQRPAGKVFLFAIKSSSALRSAPPVQPDYDSHGIQVGTWREAGIVYVLVVIGDDKAYQRVVGTTRLRAV